MTKEYKIEDILNAVDSIQKIKKKTNKLTPEENNFEEKNDILSHNKQAKTGKSEILVLDQMIE